MKPIKDLKELKNIELEILKYVHKVCEENGLMYYLAGGTLLGAVRHKGFIPWDDDIDLVMPRKDYEKLVGIINSDKTYYKMICRDSDKNYLGVFGRVIDTRTKIKFKRSISESKELGVFIDIFPMDGVGSNHQKAVRRMENMGKLYRIFLWFRREAKNNACNRFICAKAAAFLEFLAKRYSFEESKYVAKVINAKASQELLERAWFQRRVLLEFEGEKFYGPEGYRFHLKCMYGDYMKLPPASQQRRLHFFQAWWKV